MNQSAIRNSQFAIPMLTQVDLPDILPIAIGFGAGAESRRPMGVAVIGGMLTSTFLTLVVIPMVYTLFSDLTARARRSSGELPSPAIAGELEPQKV